MVVAGVVYRLRTVVRLGADRNTMDNDMQSAVYLAAKEGACSYWATGTIWSGE